MRTAEHYSTLELVEHDQTATAPERDYAATAFELNGRCLGPKVCNYMLVDCKSDYEYRFCLVQRHSFFIDTLCLQSISVSRSP